MKNKVYQRISGLLLAIENCEKNGNQEWLSKHQDSLDEIEASLPSGSGIDCGTKISSDSKPDRLVLDVEFHHMDDSGYYADWTFHKIIITASLAFGFNLRITGRNRNDIKDYLADVYDQALGEDIDESAC